jgi:hypothetical protein
VILSKRNCRRTAIVVVFVAFAMIGIIGMAAVTLDGGFLYFELREVCATADAAAMAGSCDLFTHYPTNAGLDPKGTAAAAAHTVASANGYTNDGTNTTVVVNVPPQSGTYTGKAGYIEVIVTKNVQRAFSRIFGSAPVPVRARSVGRGAWVSPAGGVIILDYSSKAALNSQGNGAFTETGGPVIVNSNNSSAVVDTGNGQMIAPEFDITGGTKLQGGANLSTSPVANQVFTGMHPTPDPLAYLPQPSMPANGTMTKLGLGQGNTLYTLTPGTYTNLPTFSSGDVVILQQASANNAGGIYYINGDGFKSTGASITMDPLTSGGVMIYNAPASSADSEKVQITGNSSGVVNLSGLTSGPYTGITLWQDRNSSVPMLIEGNGSFTMTGTFYAAGALLNVNGNGNGTYSYVNSSGVTVTGSSRIGSQWISHDLSLGGNGNVNLHYAGQYARTRIISLVE